MKVVLIFSIVVLSASVHCVPAPKAIDWSSIMARYEEIDWTFQISVDHIFTIALFDNEDVAYMLGLTLGTAYYELYSSTLQQFHDDIEQQVLSEANAQGYVEYLKDFYINYAPRYIEEYVAQLSKEAAEEISVVFNATVDNTNQKGMEMYELLRQ